MIYVYRFDDGTASFVPVSSGDFTDPASVTVAPGGSSSTKKFFIRNDDENTYYTDLILRPVTHIGTPIASSTLRIKLLSGDALPVEDRWQSVGANGSTNDPEESAVLQSPIIGGAVDTRLPSLGSPGTPDTRYYPFWVRVYADKGAPIGIISLALSLDSTEHLI